MKRTTTKQKTAPELHIYVIDSDGKRKKAAVRWGNEWVLLNSRKLPLVPAVRGRREAAR